MGYKLFPHCIGEGWVINDSRIALAKYGFKIHIALANAEF